MSETKMIESMIGEEYKYGFTTDVEYDEFPKGLNEDIIRQLSEIKEEPEWLLEFRLKAYRIWKEMEEPTWHNATYPSIDFDAIQYYSAPKQKPKLDSLDDVDPKIRETYDKLGIPHPSRSPSWTAWMMSIPRSGRLMTNWVFLWKSRRCWQVSQLTRFLTVSRSLPLSKRSSRKPE